MVNVNDKSKGNLVSDGTNATEQKIPTLYGTLLAGYYTSSAPSLSNLDVSLLRLTSDGRLMVDTELTIDGNLVIDNVAVWAIDITDSSTAGFALIDASGHPQIDILTLPGSLTGYAEDSVHNSGDIGVMGLTVRNDTLAALAGTDGDYAPAQVDANGALYVNLTGTGTSAYPAVLARTTGTEQPASTDDALVVYNVAASGSASASALYRATTTGRGDGVVVYASGTTLTFSGLPITLASEDIVYIKEVDATGNTANVWINGTGGVHMEVSGSTLTRSGGSDFSANGVYEVGYNAQDKGFESATNSFRHAIINRDTDKDVADTLLALTNIATNTTGYGYIDLENYKYLVIQNETSGTTPTDTLTLTLEATAQNDGTAAASCTYQDVTTELTGSASFVDTDCMWIIDIPVKFKYLRIKYVTSNDAGDDADLTTYVIKGV